MEQPKSKDDLDYLLPPNCPNTYYDTWDRHNSIAFSTAAKGLHNAPGENNCFVNSAVQVFWHLDVFRRSYRRLSGHTCMGNSCIFCALKVIFTQFQFSDQSSLHPDALRKALADTFANQQRFQLGHMDDAAECFENILKRLHFHVANGSHEDTCTAPHCLPHRKFSLSIVEKVVCPCGASSKPLQYCEMVHYISASALVSQAQKMQKSGDELHPDHFGLLLRSANALGDMRRCPGGCGKTVQIRRTLLNAPDVVSIGLGWDSDHPTMEMTTKVAQNIGTTILLQDVFHSVMQDIKTKVHLVGLVCYYGKHYSTFVFHSKLQVWIYFDDTTVKEIGPSFEHVVDKCSKGRYQPLLLLYANPNATPVPVETAPKKRVMAPGFGLPGAPEEESSLDRTHESISSQNSYQRAMTPNPEPTTVSEQPSHPRARSVTPSSYEGSRKGITSPSPTISEHSRQDSFMMAMTATKSDKSRHPLKLGGQSGYNLGSGGTPGPMTPVSEQFGTRESAFHPAAQGDNYADYTLSTSDQYRRPSISAFQAEDLPLPPNLKGDSPRKDGFKKGKEAPPKVDIIRYPGSNQVYHHSESSQISQSSVNSRISATSYQGNSHSHARHRTMSQGRDEAYASDSSSCDAPSQHTIVKPTVESQAYDRDGGGRISYSHTPVQSGLATLPRKKKTESQGDRTSNHSQQDSMSSVDTLTRQGSMGNLLMSQDPRQMSNMMGKSDLSRLTPTRDHTGMSTSVPCTAGRIDQVDGVEGRKPGETDKKLKKLKKELKKGDKKKVKSLSDTGTMEDYKQSLTLMKAMHDNEMRAPEDDHIQYINRNMVANVLRNQGLQRQPSTHSTTSHTSSSSIESDSIMGKLLAAKRSEGGSHTDVSFDNVSLGSHKDSGYGSSDRNSSSSTGSGTVDPHVQYFISKSMVVPRNLNPQFLDRQQMVSDFTSPTPQVYPGMFMGQGDSKTKDDKNRMNEPISQRKIMHPIKESSQEDILKVMSNISPPPFVESFKSSVPITETLSKEGRPPPIPPKNFAAFQISKSVHYREPSVDSLDKDEVENDYFISMCEKADELMDRCIISETHEELTSALRFCDSALGCLKEAMNQTDISNKALVYAQKKHNSCLLKSRSLFKRSAHHGSSDSSSHTGKRSSITSTDSDNSDKAMRRIPSKEQLPSSYRPPLNPAHSVNTLSSQRFSGSSHSLNDNSPSRQSPLPGPQVLDAVSNKGDSHLATLRTKTMSPHFVSGAKGDDLVLKTHLSRAQVMDRSDSSSNHSRSGSNSSVRSSVSVPCSIAQFAPQGLPKSQSSMINPSSNYPPSASVPLDQYGTLPRNRKPRRTSDPTGNSEVYQNYLNKQKNLASDCSVDRSSSDSRESDSSSEGNGEKKGSKVEMRELLANNIVQVQKHNNLPTTQMKSSTNVMSGSARQSIDGVQQHGPVRGQYVSDMRDPHGNTSRPLAVVSSTQPGHRNSPLPSSQGHLKGENMTRMPMTNLSQSRMHAASPSDFHQTQQRQLLPQNSAPLKQGNATQQQNFHHPSTAYPSHPVPHSAHHLKQYSDISPPSTSSVPFSQPPPNLVSGYNHPLPGQRGYPSVNRNQRQGPVNTTSSPAPVVVHSHDQQENLNHGQQANINHLYSQGNKHFPSNSSQNPAATHFTPVSHQTAVHPNIRNSNSNPQNLNPTNMQPPMGPRRNGPVVQPPPPPMRTTSNPDFKLHLLENSTPSSSSSVNNPPYPYKQQQIPNVACVQPYGHPAQNSPLYNQDTSSASSNPLIQGSQLKHASSNSRLNTIPAAPPVQRPLERYGSQPDCQNFTANQTDMHPIAPPSSHSPSYPYYPTATNPQQSQGSQMSAVKIPEHLPSNQTNSRQNANQNNEHSEPQQSVRALLSKFNQPTDRPATKPKPPSLRVRSKSESGKKPKSVLKTKKAKSAASKSRKSVTFAEDFSVRASGYESAAELSTFSSRSHSSSSDRAYFSDDEEHLGSLTTTAFHQDNDDDDVENSSNSDDYPLVHEDLACQLCRKREIEPGKGYCSKCSFYMSRLS